ncbi:MAG TPA: site-specific DNA-methyltransferase [Candidatus Latescibacteria bacterium]|nr:site-specific DNA-methyltransferase [Candidatus Latescibacterota bacterium]
MSISQPAPRAAALQTSGCGPRSRVVFGDARSMDTIGDGSTQLVVTSPPYWQLKDYGSDDQLGFADSYEDYINQLNLVWSECHRVLAPGCRLCVNIGDQFARSAYYGRYKVIPIRTEVIRFCETVGFDYMGAIIWQKVTTTNSSGGGAVMGSYPYPRNGVVKLDYEFILLFRRHGQPERIDSEQKKASAMTPEEWNTYFSGHWNFPGQRQDRHLAAFPEELPKRLIQMFSFDGETVLDPFLGSGTTSVAAARLNRASAGYEVNTDFGPVISERLASVTDRIEIEQAPATDVDWDSRVDELPYRFQDPVPMDRKVDPRQRAYGSRIDRQGSGNTPEDLCRVEEVLAPDVVQLDTGKRVRLLGVRSVADRRRQAEDRLRELTGGQRVFLRYDDACADTDGSPLVYLYLRNKTPVNRHLIRSGFVDVDTSREYRFKRAFLDEKSKARQTD